MKNKILSVLLITVFLISIIGAANVAQATSSQQANNKKKETQEKLDQLNNQMKDLQDEQQRLCGQMDEYEQELVELMVEVDLVKKDVSNKEAEYKKVKKELKVAKAEEKKQYDAMKIRIKYMYEQGETSFIEAILGAESMAELLNQAEYYEKVYDYDRKLLVTYQEARLETQRLKKQVKTELAELKSMEKELKVEQAALEKVTAKLKNEISDFDAKLASAKSKANQYKKTIEKQNKIIEEARKREEEERRREEEERNRGDNGGGSGGGSGDDNGGGSGGGSGGGGSDPGYSSNVTPQQLISYAEQFVGKPYVWGGNDPHTGADCSGFIHYVYAHFGIMVARDSYSLRHAGREVSLANAKPGDILCYPGHVALYYAGGQRLHARGRQWGICITPGVNERELITIRRVL